MTKLVILTSEFAPFRGGVGTYVRELAMAAHEQGYQVTILAPNYHADQSALDATMPFRIIRYTAAAAGMMGLPTRVWATFRLLWKEKFDIIHAADWPFFIPVRLARRRNARTLLTVHGTEIIYMGERKRRFILQVLRFWRRGWATWIGNSIYTTNLLLLAFPQIGASQCRAIPLAVSDAWRKQRKPREVARREWGLGSADVVIISLGRVVPRKGHLDVADALALLPEPLTRQLRWWVIGPLIEQEHAENLRTRMAKLPFEASLLGALPAQEVASRLSAVDIFCLPGYQDEAGRVEGFGLVFLEAAAFGIPSIATRSGGIPEAVEEGESGILVPERDPVSLAKCIERLLVDDCFRAKLAAGAEKKAETATWSRVMLQTYAPSCSDGFNPDYPPVRV